MPTIKLSAITPQYDIMQWLRSNMQPSVSYELTIEKATKHRTLTQNGQLRIWYKKIAKGLPEDSLEGWERLCKLQMGVPILRAEDDEFRAFYDTALKHLPYEFKIKAMDFTPVTSRMTTEQFNRYFEAMHEYFLQRGVVLEFLR